MLVCIKIHKERDSTLFRLTLAPRDRTGRKGGIVIILVVVSRDIRMPVECLLYRNLGRDLNYFFFLFCFCCMTFILSRLKPTFAANSIFRNKIIILNFLRYTLINSYNITDYKKSYFLFYIIEK